MVVLLTPGEIIEWDEIENAVVKWGDGLIGHYEENELRIYDSQSDKNKEIEAARKLCEIYFNIAAETIGEDAVRAKRDELIKGELCQKAIS